MRPASGDVAGAYVSLALAADRLQRGLVDRWTGPPEVRSAVEADRAATPAELASRARELRAALPDSGLAPARAGWLDGQLTALGSRLRVLQGEPVGWLQQVEDSYRVRPVLGDVQVYADAHAELGRLLPGSGPVAWRWAAHRRRDRVPPARLGRVVPAVTALLRDRTAAAVGLPPGEAVDSRLAADGPWSALWHWCGGRRSEVTLNPALPVRLGGLARLLAHEAYPGHHTEAVRAQADPTTPPEAQLSLAGTPQALVSEGAAELGLHVLGLDASPAPLGALYADLGLPCDVELAARLAAAAEPLATVPQDAALLLHDRGASVEEVTGHLTRWGLQPPAVAAATLRFITDPLWGTAICTYAEGARLVGRWLDARPPEQPVGARFAQLLDTRPTPAELRGRGEARTVGSAAPAASRSGSADAALPSRTP